MDTVNTETALQNIQRLTDNIETVIKGKRNQIKICAYCSSRKRSYTYGR